MSADTDPEKNEKSEGSEKPETNGKAEGGHSLMPATESTGVDPFIAAAKDGPEEPAPRSWRAKALDYSAHAAIIVGLLGFTWTVSDHVVNRPSASAERTAAAETARKNDEIADLRKANTQLEADIKGLRANLDSLRVTVRQDRMPAQVRALEASLASTKSDSAAAIAQLSSKIDKLQRDPNSKIQQLVDRLGKLEHQTIDTTTTGSIGTSAVAKTAAPTPPAKPAAKSASQEDARKAPVKEAALKDEADSKPQVIDGWYVRDVQEGVALVAGRRGQMEVVPGMTIPGAGVVKSIDRRGSGWTITTSKGEIAYATSQREYHRPRPMMRDYYAPPYRYGY